MKTMFTSSIESWLSEIVRIKVKPSTYDGYEYRFRRYIKPFFINRIVEEVTSKDIQEFVSTLVHEKTKLPLSPTTIHGIVNLVSDFYDYCLTKDLVDKNPCLQVTLPKRKQKKVVVLNNREQKVILKELQDRCDSKAHLVLVALYTGMRLGELCSLRWEYIDLKNRIIVVKTSKRRIKNNDKNKIEKFSNAKVKKTREVITSPKTDDSEREIPIASVLLQVFEQQSALESEYVFPKKNGKRYDNRSLQQFFSECTRKSGIKGKSFHSLRHTFATMAIESKMDVKTLSIILGHSNVNTTLNLYVHPNEKYIRESMEVLATYIAK